MRQLRHPNIVGLYGSIIESNSIALVLELVEGVTLQHYVLELPTPVISHRFSALFGVCCGLMYLHSRQPRIVHGDMKGGNVLVKVANNKVNAKILDFGLSRVLAGSPRPLGGSLAWVAPEVYRVPGLPPKKSTGVFSFGRIMYLTLACRRPHAGIPYQQLRHMLQTPMLPALLLPGDHPVERHCTNLMDSCLRINESHRPSMQEIHETLSDASSQFDELETQHIVESRAQLLSWSPPAVARCLNASPSISKIHDRAPSAAIVRSGLANTDFPKCDVVEPPCTEHGPGQVRLVLPDWPATSERRMLESILECVQSWNFPLPESAKCCPFHAGLQAVTAMACKLANQVPCQPDFMPIGASQCKECGLILAEVFDTCEQCCSSGAPKICEL